MKNSIFFAVFALFMGLATITNAQGRGNNRNYNGRNYNNAPQYRNNQYGYNHGYNNYYHGRRHSRRIVRRPVTFCQPVVYQQPCYRRAPRVFVGRPRINVNIGF